jgi:site-specific recombinase XerD
MPREAKLRKKTIKACSYWYTDAGGPTYFGRVDDVSYKDARQQFRDHLKSLDESAPHRKGRRLTAGDLVELFLEWVQQHRSKQSYATRRIYCSKFTSLKIRGGAHLEDVPASKVTSSDLEAFLAHLGNAGLSDQTIRHAETSVRHCWNWGTKHPSPTSYLPPTFRPFSAVERLKTPPRTLSEADLITTAEIARLYGRWGLAKRFAYAKKLGAILGKPVRDRLTVYAFRHLWISEALMAGIDIATVARMAGTSIAMIERVYGHFTNAHLQQAQDRLDRYRRRRQREYRRA